MSYARAITDSATASEGLSWVTQLTPLQLIGLAAFLLLLLPMLAFMAYVVRFLAAIGMIMGFLGACNGYIDKEGGSILEGGHLELLGVSAIAYLVSEFLVRQLAKSAGEDSPSEDDDF
jgi:hypothetical protein